MHLENTLNVFFLVCTVFERACLHRNNNLTLTECLKGKWAFPVVLLYNVVHLSQPRSFMDSF